MKIINGLLGEYIYISKLMYPNVVIFYNNKKVLKSEEITNIEANIKGIAKSLNCLDGEYVKYVLANLDDIEEVVFSKDGLVRFSIKPKGE